MHLPIKDCPQLSLDLADFFSLLLLQSAADGRFKRSDSHRQQTEGSVWKITSWDKFLRGSASHNVSFMNFNLEIVLAWHDCTTLHIFLILLVKIHKAGAGFHLKYVAVHYTVIDARVDFWQIPIRLRTKFFHLPLKSYFNHLVFYLAVDSWQCT